MGGTKKPDGKKQGGVGHYILGKTIGEGTFGKVKLGTHILTGETVAVKILERERIKEIADVQRVAREIHILKRVQHPHIIQLYEIIETPRQLFLIMEYCSGGELFDHIVECGRVPEGDAWRFMHQILSGVEQIHKINVVHRDLKPENLLLSKEKAIKIVDFGLSNIYKDDQLLKTACGSPCYAPPEMIAGHWYVPSRCDIWSCGVIMFALVCGYLPFEDTNTRELYNKILNADYRTPKFISLRAHGLIGAMLTIDPEDRITIPEIREHPWYKEHDPNSNSQSSDAADANSGDEEFDEDILKQLVDLGYQRDSALECLKARRHNEVTTAYFLLLLKRRRIAEQQAAGALSEDFEEGEGLSLAAEGAEEHAEEAEGDTTQVASQSPRCPMKRTRGKFNWRTPVGTMQGCISPTDDAVAAKGKGYKGKQGRGRGGRRKKGERNGAY